MVIHYSVKEAYMSLFTSGFSLRLERQARVVSVREIIIILHS